MSLQLVENFLNSIPQKLWYTLTMMFTQQIRSIHDLEF